MSLETISGWFARVDVKKSLIALAVTTVLVIGLALRLTMVFETETGQQLYGGGDTAEYYSYAYNLVHHGVYSRQWPASDSDPVPDAKRNPGYSLFLALFLMDSSDTFNSMLQPVLIAQAAISAITILFAIGFFRGFLSWPWSCSAALMMAISPHLITTNINVLTETLFTFFLVVFSYFIRLMVERRTWRWALFAGLAFGAALLVRPTLQYFLVFLLPAFFVFFPRREAIRLGGFLVIGFMLCYGPWVARNIITLDASSKSILAVKTIQKGMYPDLMYRGKPETYGLPNLFDPQYKKLQDMGSVLGEVSRRVRNEPLRYLEWYAVGKPLMFLSWGIVVGRGDIFIYPVKTSPYHAGGVFMEARRIIRHLHWPSVILALVCSIFVWTSRARLLIDDKALTIARYGSLMLLYFMLVHVAGLPLPRYAIPIKPVIFGMALLGAQTGFVMLRRFLRKSSMVSD